jgi:hypothetical protein
MSNAHVVGGVLAYAYEVGERGQETVVNIDWTSGQRGIVCICIRLLLFFRCRLCILSKQVCAFLLDPVLSPLAGGLGRGVRQ